MRGLADAALGGRLLGRRHSGESQSRRQLSPLRRRLAAIPRAALRAPQSTRTTGFRLILFHLHAMDVDGQLQPSALEEA